MHFHDGGGQICYLPSASWRWLVNLLCVFTMLLVNLPSTIWMKMRSLNGTEGPAYWWPFLTIHVFCLFIYYPTSTNIVQTHWAIPRPKFCWLNLYLPTGVLGFPCLRPPPPTAYPFLFPLPPHAIVQHGHHVCIIVININLNFSITNPQKTVILSTLARV